MAPLVLASVLGSGVAAQGACDYEGRCPDWQRTDAQAPSVNDATAALGGRIIVDAGVLGASPAVVAYGAKTGRRVWSTTVAHPGVQDGEYAGVGSRGAVLVATGSWDRGTVAASGYPIGAAMTAAFDARTGSMLWQREALTSGGLDYGAHVVFSPDGSVVYSVGIVGENSSNDQPGRWRVIAYRTSGGRELWRWSSRGTALHQQIAGAALSSDGSTLVLAGEDHNGADPDWLVAGLDTRTRRLRWTDRRDAGNDVPTTVVSSADGSAVYVVGVSEPLSSSTTFLTAPPVQLQTIAYAASTGRVRWVNHRASDEDSFWAFDATADPHGGVCIAGSVSDQVRPAPTLPYLTCLDAHGDRRWEQLPDLSGLPNRDSEYWAVGVHPASGTLVVGGYDAPDTHGTTQYALVRAFRLSDGRQQWESKRNGDLRSYPTTMWRIVDTSAGVAALGIWTPPTATPFDSPGAAYTVVAGFRL